MGPFGAIRSAEAGAGDLRRRDPARYGGPEPSQTSLGAMDINVERNAYGRQLDSSIRVLEPEEDFARRTHPGTMEAVFIPRADHPFRRPRD